MVKHHYGISTERYKLIHYYYDLDEWELFDLQKDPLVMGNLPARQMTDFLYFDSFEIHLGGHFYSEDFSSFDILDINKNSADSLV